MTGVANDGLLWGDAQVVTLPLPAPGIQPLRQLINVWAPMPTTWNVLANILHPSGAGVEPDATTTLLLFCDVGIGRVMQRVTFVFQRTVAPTGVLFTAQVRDLPAQSLVVSASLFSVVPGPAQWTVGIWVAPSVPWKGTEVSIKPAAQPRPR